MYTLACFCQQSSCAIILIIWDKTLLRPMCLPSMCSTILLYSPAILSLPLHRSIRFFIISLISHFCSRVVFPDAFSQIERVHLVYLFHDTLTMVDKFFQGNECILSSNPLHTSIHKKSQEIKTCSFALRGVELSVSTICLRQVEWIYFPVGEIPCSMVCLLVW